MDAGGGGQFWVNRPLSCCCCGRRLLLERLRCLPFRPRRSSCMSNRMIGAVTWMISVKRSIIRTLADLFRMLQSLVRMVVEGKCEEIEPIRGGDNIVKKV